MIIFNGKTYRNLEEQVKKNMDDIAEISRGQTYTAGDGIGISDDNAISVTPATSSALGGVKVGDNLTVSDDGTLSAEAGTTYTAGDGIGISDDNAISVTPATSSALGGVKVGDNLTVSDDGTLSAETGTTYTAGSNIAISDDNVISASNVVTTNTAQSVSGTKTISSGATIINTVSSSSPTTDNNGFVAAVSSTDRTRYGVDGIVRVADSSTSYSYTYPDKSGTLAMLSDIAGGGEYTAGQGINISSSGEIDVTPATSSALGGVKVGSGLAVGSDGTLSVDLDTVVTVDFPNALETPITYAMANLLWKNPDAVMLWTDNSGYTWYLRRTFYNTGSTVDKLLHYTGTRGQIDSTDTSYPKLKIVTINIEEAPDEATWTNIYAAGEQDFTLDYGGSGGGTTYTAGDGIAISDDNAISVTPATSSALGGVKVGDNLTVSDDGTLSATGGGTTYTAGDNIAISDDNVISASNVVTTDTTQTVSGPKTFTSQISIRPSKDTYATYRYYGITYYVDSKSYTARFRRASGYIAFTSDLPYRGKGYLYAMLFYSAEEIPALHIEFTSLYSPDEYENLSGTLSEVITADMVGLKFGGLPCVYTPDGGGQYYNAVLYVGDSKIRYFDGTNYQEVDVSEFTIYNYNDL